MNSKAALEAARVYDAHAAQVYRYVYYRLGDKTLAEDLTSEAFVRYVQARVRPAKPLAYLFRIAHNLVVDHLRRHSFSAAHLHEGLADEGLDPVESAAVEFEKRRLRAALARLTPEQAEVLVLKFLEGLSNAQVAQLLGKPEGAVKSLQHRGLEALRRLLDETEETARATLALAL